MTSIEWTQRPGTKGETWNPIVGCKIISPGCKRCYAMKEAMRQIRCAAGLKRSTHYEGTVETVNGRTVWTGEIKIAPDSIFLKPLTWRSPRTVFVNSMGDLFHEDVPDEQIDRAVAIMALCPQHTFQVLTKRAERMREYVTSREHVIGHILAAQDMVHAGAIKGPAEIQIAWPLPNVWLGVSTERQQEADERIPLLLQTPAAVRFISAEPLLGPIDVRQYLEEWSEQIDDITIRWNAGLDWVIAGGESGDNEDMPRPTNAAGVRSLRDQCKAAGVPFFFKKWGRWLMAEPVYHGQPEQRMVDHWKFPDGDEFHVISDGADIVMCGAETRKEVTHLWKEYWADGHGHLVKIAKDRKLDGREHNEWPEAAA